MGYGTRRARRFLPKNAVTVAVVNEDVPVAFGVVKDISEVGARIVTETPVGPEADVHLKMSFYRTGMVTAGGRVVWSHARSRPGGLASETEYGVEFTALSAGEKRFLQTLLDMSDFGVPAD